MSEYISNRQRNLKVGISSYTENQLVLDVTGNANITGVTSLASAGGITTTGGDLYVGGTIFLKDITLTPGIIETNYLNVSVASTLGIASATSLTVSGITTIGGVAITPSGIITSSNPGVSTVVYYGDGSHLIGVNAFNVVTQDVVSTPVYPTFANNVGVSSVGISSTQFVFVPATGSLGIGTTNPTSKLTVSGDVDISGVTTVGEVTITSSGIITSSNPGVSTVVYYGDGSHLIGVNAFNVVTQDIISGPVYPTFASNAGVSSVGISSEQFVFIPSSGFIGIGTTNPTSKLTVIGGGNFSGVVTASSFIPSSGYIKAPDGTNSFYIYSGTGNVAFQGTIGASQVNNASGYKVLGFTGLNDATFENNVYISGITTSVNGFVGNLTGTATTATKLENTRTFEIIGDIIAAPQNFDGTQNVSLASSIQPNTVGLGTHTYGDYVKNITGTIGEIEVNVTSGEGVSPQIGLPDNVTIANNLTVTNDLQVNHDLNVNGNITIGGTSAFLIVNDFRVKDKDIVLGFTTDSYGNDASTDITANHGGISVASTEGNPLVQLYNPGIGETTPATYKKIMWFKSGSFTGLNTDAWLINYGVGIGSTQIPYGVQLAVGDVQFTENDLSKVRNITASGIGNIPSLFGTDISYSGIATFGSVRISSGIVTATSGIVTYYGDGYNLTRVRNSYQQNNTLVGSATTLNFIGAGVSSVTITNDVVTVNIPNTVKTISSYTATEGQTVFSATYNLGLVDVYLNGSKLSQSDYTATDGLTVVLTEGAALNDLVEIVGYVTYKVVGTQTILVDTVTSSSGIITSYTGIADQGSSQSANVWTIRRSIFTPAGITSSTGSAVNVAWINRYTVVYV